ncbi:MAG: hypothetical protein ACRENG_36710, partial [bacterium]
DAPWITKDGYFDVTKFPIDSILAQIQQEDEESFLGALSVLQSMQLNGRQEAGIFLMGFLANLSDDWEKRIEVVKALKGFHTLGCANLLFSEMKRVKSSNTTRKYLNTILEVLADMPLHLIESGFDELIEDKSFSYRMKKKFENILEETYWGEKSRDTS